MVVVVEEEVVVVEEEPVVVVVEVLVMVMDGAGSGCGGGGVDSMSSPMMRINWLQDLRTFPRTANRPTGAGSSSNPLQMTVLDHPNRWHQWH